MSSSPTDPLQHEPTGLFKNTVFVGLAKATAGLMALVYILAARVLGDAGFGDFTLGLTIGAILAIVSGWGTNRYSSIIAAREPGRTTGILAENLGLTIVLTGAYLILVLVTGVLVSGDRVVVTVAMILGVDFVIRGYTNLLRLFFRVHDLYRFESVTMFGERLGVVAASGAVLLLLPTPVMLAAAFVGGRLAGSVFTSAIYLRNVGPIRIRFDREVGLDLFRAGTPIAVRGGLSSLNLRADMLILGGFRSSSEVGWYGAVYKLLEGMLMLPGMILGSLGPHLSANFGADRHDVVRRLFGRSLKYLMIAGLFLSAALGVLADPLVDIVYGDEYAPAALALQILAITVVFAFLRQAAIEVLDNVDRREATVGVFGIAVGLNVGLNLFMIPRYGYVGAAISTAVSEFVLAGALYWTLYRAQYAAHLLRLVRVPLLAALLAGGLMLALISRPVIAAVAGGLIYLGIVTVLGTWDFKDRQLVRDLVSQGKERLSGWRG